MPRKPTSTTPLAALAGLAFIASLAPWNALEASGLEETMARVLERPAFRGSAFGILVEDLRTGKTVYAHRPEALLPPASTTKIVSCGGTLAVLGKDFRFETPVIRTGPVKDGVLAGDLVLVGKGDPNLSQRIGKEGRLLFENKDHSYAGFSESAVVPGDPLRVLRELARAVRAAGITEIEGDVVVDDGFFSERRDAFIGNFSAICVNDNLVDIFVSPGERPGSPPRVRYQPDLPAVEVEVSAVTAPSESATDLWVEPKPGVATFELSGTIAVDAPRTLRVGRLLRPALAAAHYLGELLEREGISVSGERREARFGPSVYRSYPVVARHVSPPLSEAVRVALKVSHNLHATMFPVLVGAIEGERGDRFSGYRVIRRYLERAGIDHNPVILGSGSGGGRADRLSGEFLVSFLKHMAAREDFREFYDALPIGGVDGTLSERFRSSRLRGRVRAKTGTLVYRGALNDRWIYLTKTLAGYIDLRASDAPDRMLVFSIAIANTVCENRAKGARELFEAQEDIIEAVVEAVDGGGGFRGE